MTNIPQQLSVQSGDISIAAWHHPNEGKPTLVFVHGYPDTHEVWNKLTDRLRDDFQIITYDVRGSGASDKPLGRKNYSYELLAQDLRAVIDHTCPDEAVHLVAFDWGDCRLGQRF